MRRIELEVVGDTRGRWDGPRLQQVLRNLVTNAIKYGAADEPVRVTLTGDGAGVRFRVANRRPGMEQSDLDRLFDPLVGGPAQDDGRDDDGLGLFIIREVVRAHDSEVAARLGGGETVFEVRLPRRQDDATA